MGMSMIQTATTFPLSKSVDAIRDSVDRLEAQGYAKYLALFGKTPKMKAGK